jgi:hypothetical protein
MSSATWLFDLIFGRRIDPKAEVEKELTAKYGRDWHKYDGVIYWTKIR